MTEIHTHTEDELQVEEEAADDAVAVDYDIISYPADHTLASLNEMYKDGTIVVPDYQRGFVWTIEQASLLIDSFLSGLPVPEIFLYVEKDNKNLVIDGQQRIMSIVYFFKGQFGEPNRGVPKGFRLKGLGENSPRHNKKFDELDESAQRKLKQAVLRAVNVRQVHPAGKSTSAYHIFERLNTGGTSLRPQEIRNCVFRGKFNNALKKANRDKHWRKVLGMPNPDKRQKDVELLLRVFSLFAAGDGYKKPMKEFLNKTMDVHRGHTSGDVQVFFKTFPTVAERVAAVLGEKPFHLHRKGPLNGPALDSVMSVLLKNAHRLDRVDIKARYDELRKNKKFEECTKGKTTDTKVVRDRLNVVEDVFFG